MVEEPETAQSRKSTRLGEAGEAARQRVRDLRDTRGMTGAQLSARMKELGRPIPLLGIQRIESGERRIDIDDLVALAVALEVSPMALLLPKAETADEIVAVGLKTVDDVLAERFLKWLRAETPLDRDDLRGVIEFQTASWPPWADLPIGKTLTPEYIAEKKRQQGEHIRRRRAQKKAASDGDD